MTDTAALFTAKTPPNLFAVQAPSVSAPLGSTGGNGAISGGLLRPGAIDQTTFLQMLQQQQQNRQAAGVGGKPVAMPIQSFQPAIPTLTSAQFAALVGAQDSGENDLAAEAAEGPAADPQAIAVAQQAQARLAAQMVPAQSPAQRLSGAANRNAASSPAAAKPAEGVEKDSAGDDAPTISRSPGPPQTAAADATATGAEAPEIRRQGEQTAAAAVGDEKESTESAAAGQGDPDVVHLKSPPDKDQQTELRMRHKRWVVDETPGARQLFFGADGKFGWDDFLDVINPLQHIPIVAQIYRAVTGDEINGAANLLGAIPFGPLGGISMMAAVTDLAVKDVTGEDIGGNLQAMVFGKGDKPKNGAEAVPADMAENGAKIRTATVQTASSEDGYALSDSSRLHEACRG